jgi:hypothetical protein
LRHGALASGRAPNNRVLSAAAERADFERYPVTCRCREIAMLLSPFGWTRRGGHEQNVDPNQQ